jgi:hypothetical protein
MKSIFTYKKILSRRYFFKSIIIFSLTLIVINAKSQTTFHEIFHDNSGGQFLRMKRMQDGCYFMSGNNLATGDIIFSKTDSDGNIIFCKSMNKPEINDFLSQPNGHLLLCTESAAKMNLMRTDFYGNFISNTGYTSTQNFGCSSFIQLSDGSLILAGQTGISLLIIKIDSSGNVHWGKKYNIPNFLQIGKIIKYGNNILVIAAVTDSLSINLNPFVAELDTAGNVLWSETYNIKMKNFIGGDITANGFVLCFSQADTVNIKTLLMKFDSAGSPQWTKVYSTSVPTLDGIDVKTVFNSGFILTGDVGQANVPQHAFLIRVDTSGNVLWANQYGGLALETIFNVEVANDTGFAFAGISNGFTLGGHTTGYLAKTNSNGNIGCFEQPISINRDTLVVLSYSSTITSSVFTLNTFSATTPTMANDTGYFVCMTTSTGPEIHENNLKLAYQNPSTGIFDFKFENSGEYQLVIYDCFGKLIVHSHTVGANAIVDLRGIARGIYFVKIFNQNLYCQTKIIIEY